MTLSSLFIIQHFLGSSFQMAANMLAYGGVGANKSFVENSTTRTRVVSLPT